MPDIPYEELTTEQIEALERLMSRWPEATADRIWYTAKNVYVSISMPNVMRPQNRHAYKYYWLDTGAQLRKSFWKRVG